MFKGGGLGDLMKQAQQLQDQVKSAQEEFGRLEFTGESGAGMVKVLATGSRQIKRVDIDPSALDDREMLEDLITAAVNDALQRIEQANADKMGDLTKGLPLPPGMKLPF